MKRRLLLATVLLASLTVNAWAGGMGAVRVAFDPYVGWTILNTTGDGRLIVTTHLDAALPNEEFSVTLRVRYEDESVEIFPDVAVLSTNEQGKGNVSVEVTTSPSDDSSTLRRVAVRVRRAPNPLYLAVGWDIPLKPGVGGAGASTGAFVEVPGSRDCLPDCDGKTDTREFMEMLDSSLNSRKAAATIAPASWGMIKAQFN